MSENNIKITGRYIGVDYGDVRTGLAQTDLSCTLASSIGNIKPGGMRHTAVEVARIAQEARAIKIIVGLPKNMNGTDGERVRTVEAFIQLLREHTNIEIDTIDERLTTVEAYNYLNQTDTASRKRRSIIDGLSAQIMLQNYIDREKRQNSKK